MDVNNYNGFKTQIREVLVRTKAVLDVYVLNTKPKFGGNKISLQ